MEKLKSKYEINKSKAIGEEISCAVCNKVFKKKTKQQAFCGGRGDTKCKDKYWNTVTPNKKNNKTRISPASARWLENNREHRGSNFNPDDYEHPFSSEGLGQWDD